MPRRTATPDRALPADPTTRPSTRSSTDPATEPGTDSAPAAPQAQGARLFDLSGHPRKDDPALIAQDEAHFAAIEAALAEQIATLRARLHEARRAPAGSGQAALDRDLDVHRLSARLRTLQRYGVDLCLGRMVLTDTDTDSDTDSGTGTDTGTDTGTGTGTGLRPDLDPDGATAAPDGGEDPHRTHTVYVGRLGLTGADGRRLLVDWRSPAAEPFFAATLAQPLGLVTRRRYRWTRGRVVDFWDETFTDAAPEGRHAASLDDESAFIAGLGASRSPRMRDVLATIAADQDAIIRASSQGALVVDGGPGTGKTVVALHRAAYLLYADPRLGHRRGGVLFVGPHQPYLAYVADVLPSLGEDGVRTCTLADLVPQGATAAPERDQAVADLKADARMVAAIGPAIRFYEEPPVEPLRVRTPFVDVQVEPQDWETAFDAPSPGTPHNEAHEEIWEELLDLLVERYGTARTADALRRELRRHSELRSALAQGWPMIEPEDLVGDLWSVPAYLRMCAPHLSREQIRAAQREDPQAWTTADLPLLDAARAGLGDPEAAARQRRAAATQEAERERMDRVVDDLLEHDDSELQVMSMLTGADLQRALVDEGAVERLEPDALAGPFAHVVVDEAQELTDAQWQMLLARCPSRSFTIVGDRAQARRGFPESWGERLARVGVDRAQVASLSVNYRTPAEIMDEAAPVIRAVLPDANVPTSIRSTGLPVLRDRPARVGAILSAWLDEHAEGIACVIADPALDLTELCADLPELTRAVTAGRVRSLTPSLAKGLEFDLVALVDPQRFGSHDDPVAAAVDRYVAMTRATGQLVILTDD